MFKSIAAIALAITLSACHSPSRIIEVNKWTVTQRKEQLVLTERVSHPSTWDTGLKVVEGAMPGVYKAEREDPEGTYFIGSGKPIWFSIPTGKGESTFVRQGGIYVPHNRAVPPHFIFVVESTAPLAGSINDYELQQTVQNIALPSNAPVTGAGIVGGAIGFAVVSAFATMNDGKYARLFPINDATARQKILAGIEPSP
jgi:hypothetical protein